jgi:hypothetical protein
MPVGHALEQTDTEDLALPRQLQQLALGSTAGEPMLLEKRHGVLPVSLISPGRV